LFLMFVPARSSGRPLAIRHAHLASPRQLLAGADEAAARTVTTARSGWSKTTPRFSHEALEGWFGRRPDHGLVPAPSTKTQPVRARRAFSASARDIFASQLLHGPERRGGLSRSFSIACRPSSATTPLGRSAIASPPRRSAPVDAMGS